MENFRGGIYLPLLGEQPKKMKTVRLKMRVLPVPETVTKKNPTKTATIKSI